MHKIQVKFFVRDPRGLDLSRFIPVFHEWIRERRAPGTLIDVADYTHVPDGPGVILVSIEADWSMDATEGPVGLLYSRKFPVDDPIRHALESALRAAKLLEEQTGVRFAGEEIRIIVNDRKTPNDDESLEALRPDLEPVLDQLYESAEWLVLRDPTEPRRRLTLDVRSTEAVGIATLLERIGAVVGVA